MFGNLKESLLGILAEILIAGAIMLIGLIISLIPGIGR